MNVAQYVCWSKSSQPIDLRRCITPVAAYKDDKAPSSSLFTVVDAGGKTAAHFASQRGNLQLLETLFSDVNSTPDAFQSDWQGRTLMHYATESSRCAQTIDMLAARGFDARAVDHTGRTVLHHAASLGTTAAVEKLIELGAAADLEKVDQDSRTPIQVAFLCGREEVVDLLSPLCGAGAVEVEGNQLEREETEDGRREPKSLIGRFIYDDVIWGRMRVAFLFALSILIFQFLL
jgi:ankyrin repeat protein